MVTDSVFSARSSCAIPAVYCRTNFHSSVSNLRKVCGADSAVRWPLSCDWKPDYLAEVLWARSFVWRLCCSFWIRGRCHNKTTAPDQRSFNKHQSGGGLELTVSSERDGQWVESARGPEPARLLPLLLLFYAAKLKAQPKKPKANPRNSFNLMYPNPEPNSDRNKRVDTDQKG